MYLTSWAQFLAPSESAILSDKCFYLATFHCHTGTYTLQASAILIDLITLKHFLIIIIVIIITITVHKTSHYYNYFNPALTNVINNYQPLIVINNYRLHDIPPPCSR